MQTDHRFPSTAAIPDRQTVHIAQGIPAGSAVPSRVADLIDEAFGLYARQVAPVGIRLPVSAADFAEIYSGEGHNAQRTPLEGIYREAGHLALFAVTIGEQVCSEIERLFKHGDAALGYALDTIASAGAEQLADLMALGFHDELRATGSIAPNVRVLPYSPGYCGWHVSGQRKLFVALHPERIGISLNSSCLMSPLKSVSGVLVSGDEETHAFDIDFDFCPDCATQDCRGRLQSAFHGMS